ncbi:cupin domain-containing protein [Halorhabdus sp. CBA1104]|uniref:cupin domain-containing protein n=1 Tax=unclassified Halorhabdus TaxID=2621901 RepID=UPI0012B306BA|nr:MULTISPECIES: cupin domain-containing protein [unclassified Halorhabdus]QGN07264.1 cupin domain-containing protein [Halorhabdus sp. CBA1104]
MPTEKRIWPYHYHTGNEEAICVLDGQDTLRLDGTRYDIEAGDYVALPWGEASAHQMINDSESSLG